MRPIRLPRSTPLRLALTYGIFFVLTSLGVAIFAFYSMKAELYSALDRSVKETYSIVAASYGDHEFEDLQATVRNFTTFRLEKNWVFYLGTVAGKRLEGRISKVPDQDGLFNIGGHALGLRRPDQFRVMSGIVAGHRLMVAENISETEELTRVLVIDFAWSTLLAILVAIAAGIFLARRAQQRLDRIALTMNAVSKGRLDSRIALVGTGDDIDVVSAQINEALERLSGLVQSMRQVSTDIAHDLKTPLNRLRLTLEEAYVRSGSNDALHAALEDALREGDTINATFEALLRIAQIEGGARKARFQMVDVAALMQNVAEIYANVAEDNDQSVRFERLNDGLSDNESIPNKASPVLLQGDHELLTQLFVNLVENAINHCPAGTQITLSLKQTEEDGLVASVADNGPGIPEAEREKVFRRLYRLDRSRTTPGNGLGLALVKAIADLHGLRLQLEDNAPGARFSLVFQPGA